MPVIHLHWEKSHNKEDFGISSYSRGKLGCTCVFGTGPLRHQVQFPIQVRWVKRIAAFMYAFVKARTVTPLQGIREESMEGSGSRWSIQHVPFFGEREKWSRD